MGWLFLDLAISAFSAIYFELIVGSQMEFGERFGECLPLSKALGL
jgi:hypothetical protein